MLKSSPFRCAAMNFAWPAFSNSSIFILFATSLQLFVSASGAVAQLVFDPKYNKVSEPFAAVAFGRTQWVDLDNDGDLDLIQAGEDKTYRPKTFVYENVNGTFVVRETTLPNFAWGMMAAGDYDNDGDLDMLVSATNENEERLARLYRNDGNFSFTLQYSLKGMSNSSGGFFDLDNDQDLDFVITGLWQGSFGSYTTLLYENTPTGFVESKNSNLPKCTGCGMDFADANGDGITDIMFSGEEGTYLYLSDGLKLFKKDATSTFQQLTGGEVKFGDLDNDGDPDLLITGGDQFNIQRSLIYENRYGESTGGFVLRTDINLMGFGGVGGTRLFDYNNDGRLDVLLTGNQTHRLYRNDGNGKFSETMEPSFGSLGNMSVDAGDFDNDGDVDICFSGYSFGLGAKYPLSGYYENYISTSGAKANTQPVAPSPSSFSEKISRRQIRFNWDAGADAETPGKALTYNFYLRSATKKIVTPLADLNTGFLRTDNLTNGYAQRGFVNNVPEGELFYAVQTIDGGRVASPFSAEKSFFHFNGPEALKAEIVDATKVKLTWIDHSKIETHIDLLKSVNTLENFEALTSLPANSSGYTEQFAFQTETFYHYRIQGSDGTHTSPYDSLVLMIPQTIANLQATPVNASNIKLTWTDRSQYETGFRIERSVSGTSTYTVVATVPSNTTLYTDGGVASCVTYDYRVIAISNNGGLVPTEITTAKTNCQPVQTNFAKELNEEETVSLSRANFETNYSDADNDAFVQIQIASLPVHGTLLLSGNPVSAGAIIKVEQLGNLSFKSETNFNGMVFFSFKVHDGIDYAAMPSSATMVVAPINDPPTFQVTSDITRNEDFGSYQVQAATLDNILYEVGDHTVFSISPSTSPLVGVAIDPSSGIVNFTSVKDQFGQIEFTITANDGQAENNVVSHNFKLTIISVNDAPVLADIGDIQAPARQKIQPVVIFATDDDPLALSMFSAQSSNPAVLKSEKIVFTKNDAGEIIMTLTPEKAEGFALVWVTVNDGTLTTTQDFYLTITPAVVTAIEDHQNEISAYPNPFTKDLNISFGDTFYGEGVAVLIDMLGREVTQKKITSRELILPGEDIPSGLYRLVIINDRGTQFQATIVKR